LTQERSEPPANEPGAAALPPLPAAPAPFAALFEQLRGFEGKIQDPAQKQQFEVTLQAALVASSFTSPYPPPEVLTAYGIAVPGLDRSLVAQLDQQTAHRQGLEKNVIYGNERRADRGQLIGAVIGVLGLVFGLIIALTTSAVAGVAFAGADLVALAGLFVYGSRQQQANARPPSPPRSAESKRDRPS